MHACMASDAVHWHLAVAWDLSPAACMLRANEQRQQPPGHARRYRSCVCILADTMRPPRGSSAHWLFAAAGERQQRTAQLWPAFSQLL